LSNLYVSLLDEFSLKEFVVRLDTSLFKRLAAVTSSIVDVHRQRNGVTSNFQRNVFENHQISILCKKGYLGLCKPTEPGQTTMRPLHDSIHPFPYPKRVEPHHKYDIKA
jgi:hypothetical protein